MKMMRMKYDRMIIGGSCCDLNLFGICSATAASAATITTTATKICCQCQIETFAYTIHLWILY